MPIDTSISTDTNMGNVTNVSSVNTSATGLPEGLFLTGILKQMATYLTGTSTSGITTSGSITALLFRALQEAHWYQSVVLWEFSYHKQ